jgi:hypothetical protein
MSSETNLMFCEACNADLVSGSLGTPTTRGGHLCRTCTPKLSEVVAEYNVAIASGGSFHAYGFASIGEMRARLGDMVNELTTLGDCNIAVPL